MKLSKETLSDSKKRKGWRTGERKEGRKKKKGMRVLDKWLSS